MMLPLVFVVAAFRVLYETSVNPQSYYLEPSFDISLVHLCEEVPGTGLHLHHGQALQHLHTMACSNRTSEMHPRTIQSPSILSAVRAFPNVSAGRYK